MGASLYNQKSVTASAQKDLYTPRMGTHSSSPVLDPGSCTVTACATTRVWCELSLPPAWVEAVAPTASTSSAGERATGRPRTSWLCNTVLHDMKHSNISPLDHPIDGLDLHPAEPEVICPGEIIANPFLPHLRTAGGDSKGVTLVNARNLTYIHPKSTT